MSFIEGREKAVAGSTYKDLKDLVQNIRDSRYFDASKQDQDSKDDEIDGKLADIGLFQLVLIIARKKSYSGKCFLQIYNHCLKARLHLLLRIYTLYTLQTKRRMRGMRRKTRRTAQLIKPVTNSQRNRSLCTNPTVNSASWTQVSALWVHLKLNPPSPRSCPNPKWKRQILLLWHNSPLLLIPPPRH